MKKVLGVISDYIVMTLAVAAFALAWEVFMVPNGMSSGGLTGLCSIIQFATGGAITVSVSYALINVVLLIIGFLVMGNAFGIRTIYCIAVSFVFFRLFESLPSLHAVEGNFLYVPEKMLIPLIAGLIEGVALGVVFRVGGSTGGTDIIALFFNKFWPISPGKVFLISDLVIVTLILCLPGKTFSDMVYGYLMMIVSTTMVDYVVVGKKSSVQLLVFSDKYSEIADYIINRMDRGVTVLRAQGWYTKQDKNVLLLLLNRNQLGEITHLIKDMDPNAFVSVTQTRSVFGEGFEEMKVGLRKEKNR